MRKGRRPAPPTRAELGHRASSLLDTSARRFGTEPGGSGDLDTLDGRLAVLAGNLRELLASPGDPAEVASISETLSELHTARFEIRDFLVHERIRRMEALDAGLARLRKIHEPDELLKQACEAVVASCGFDRVMLSKVDGSVWRPWKSYAIGDRAAERTFRRWIEALPEIHLDHLMLENEMVRRQEPALVVDGANDRRVYRPLLEASGLRSYVAAPLTPDGRVIGFLHADYETEQVTELDRDILWAFAEAFGQIFERAVLLARLRDQREQVRTAMRTVESVLEDLASAEIELAGREQVTALAARRPARISGTPPPALEALLTGRELEVLTLMSTGATNSRIAEKLVITDGTVKSHVKRILRKLRVENRAEAISQYLRLTMGRQ
jgi:DNA-binding CsgD family transcriptional regulator